MCEPTTLFNFPEISRRNGKAGNAAWIVVGRAVYDVSPYLDEHPGGKELILECAGMDATEAFEDAGHSADAKKILAGYKIGELHPLEQKPVIAQQQLSIDTNVKVEKLGGIRRRKMEPNYDLPAFPEDDRLSQQQLIEVPNYENEFVRAKTFLQTGSTETGENLYDHLTDVLNKILAERPENVIDFFEEYSRKVKEKRFRPQTDHLEDIYVTRARFDLAKKWQKLLRPMAPDAPSTVDPDDLEIADMSRNDMLQLLYYFELAGFGLPRTEMFAIMMSMLRLVKKEPLVALRFWGKIYGSYKNYLVVETELKEDEYIKKNEVVQKAKDEEIRLAEEAKALEAAKAEALVELPGEANPSGIPRTLPPAPTIHYEEVPEAPDELAGVGANKKVFYVCHEAGDDWIQLPEVTAKQIRVARLIRKGFSGNLEQEVLTYPEFPGNEMNYLRAQIARISAGTQISPLGFYTFGEEGGEEEEEEEEDEEEPMAGPKTSYRENLKFEPIPIRDLVDGSMSFWVHHTLTILPQGRTTWWNPYPSEGADEEMGEEEEDEDKPKKAGPEPETGPPLLTPLSEDSKLETIPPWSVRTSSDLTQNFSIAIVRSNIWPGAFCFANQGKIFQNVYLGNGLKRLAQNFSPKPLPDVQQEYPIGPEVMEITDPTGAEEEAWRIAHLPKVKEVKEQDERTGKISRNETNESQNNGRSFISVLTCGICG